MLTQLNATNEVNIFFLEEYDIKLFQKHGINFIIFCPYSQKIETFTKYCDKNSKKKKKVQRSKPVGSH